MVLPKLDPVEPKQIGSMEPEEWQRVCGRKHRHASDDGNDQFEVIGDSKLQLKLLHVMEAIVVNGIGHFAIHTCEKCNIVVAERIPNQKSTPEDPKPYRYRPDIHEKLAARQG